ncbi:TDP-N-acetylfucosamine:lipid II N-acetylfucosaminyltransferase [Frankliniella fusca]|uniref:TDP-N-acetylfucosamine:lipid II N-acetylfucosaminyltransferase n=1 Tax=Frankliniella fusca TaxID=407009 RepID=A0AAE1HFW3_9NEOP|nr:TDP-N-acetylfucosamine:lipid II N-acetylfucosaminyltransferase [Frankliniella fusca]
MPLPLHLFDGQSPGSVVFHGGDGFFYHKVNSRPNRKFTYLRCVHRNNKALMCLGSAKALLGQGLLYSLHGHSHPSNSLYPLMKAVKRDIILRVKLGDQTAFHEIVQQEGQKYPPEVRVLVPIGSIQSRLHAIRSALRPPLPRNLGVLGAYLLLPEYQYLTQCLHVPESCFAGMCGSLPEKTLSLVFITPEMKTFMQTRSTVFADGTERKLFRKPKASQIFQIVTVWRFHVSATSTIVLLPFTHLYLFFTYHFHSNTKKENNKYCSQ